MSLCNTKNMEEDDDIKITTNVLLPINNLSILKPSNLKETTPGKSKRTKSRTPKVVKFRIDQDKDTNSNQYQKKDSTSSSILHFFEITDDNRIEKTEESKTNEDKSLDSSISGLKFESEQEKLKENGENNNDSNKKPQLKWDLYTDELISNTINKLDDENKSDKGNKNVKLDNNYNRIDNENKSEEKDEKEDKDDNKEKIIYKNTINKNEENKISDNNLIKYQQIKDEKNEKKEEEGEK